jgi:hypothetical protein
MYYRAGQEGAAHTAATRHRHNQMRNWTTAYTRGTYSRVHTQTHTIILTRNWGEKLLHFKP